MSSAKKKKNPFNLTKLALCCGGALIAGFSGAAHATCTESTDPTTGGRIKTCTNETVYDGYNGLQELNITNNGYFTNAQGKTGLYINNSTGTIGDVIIVSGSLLNGDAIKFNGGGGTLTITGKLKLTTTALTADGVNISTMVSNSKLTVADDAEIEAKYGMGLRVNLSSYGGTTNSAYFGDRASIKTQGVGENSSNGEGYAVYVGNRDVETEALAAGGAYIELGRDAYIETQGNNAHAVYANKTGEIQLGNNVTIKTTGSAAHGIATLDGETTKSGTTTVRNYDGGQVYLVGDTTIHVDATKGSYAMYASGVESAIVSGKSDGSATSGVFDVTGNLVAERNGKIELSSLVGSQFVGDVSSSSNGIIALNGVASYTGDFIADTGGRIALSGGNGTYVEGKSDTSSGSGVVDISLTGVNSRWVMTDSSVATNLNLSGDAAVVLGDSTTVVDASNRKDLNVGSLSGNGAFYIRTNVVRDGATGVTTTQSDLITVTGSSSGAHKIFVDDSSTGAATGDEVLRVVDSIDQGAQFTLGSPDGYVDVGAYKYVLQLERGAGASGYWSLMTTSNYSDMAQNTVGLLNTNYLLGNIEVQTLLQRMGELRQPGNDGDVWGRVFGGKLTSFGDERIKGHDFDYSGIQLGVDRQLSNLDNGNIYIGGVLGYTSGDTSYDVGSGKSNSFHVGVYGTYAMDNGVYIDGIVKYHRIKNEVNSVTGGGYYVDGRANSNGFSLGLEVGRRFYLQQPQQGWYLEPQAQLTYSHQGGVNIRSSNGLKTELGSYNSLLGRVSIIAGYSVVSGSNPVDIYFKTGYVREFDGDTSYTFNDTMTEKYKFRGGWWDNAIGVNMRIRGQHNLYADVVYAKGSRFDKQQINVGYRYEF